MAWINTRQTKRGEKRYDVGYRGPDGRVHHATHRTRREAERFARAVETDMLRGHWADPTGGKETVRVYAQQWLASRPQLSPRTQELYEGQLRLHILPSLGEVPLARLTPVIVREWRAGLFTRSTLSENTIAKCYRLLHVMLATAVEDGLVVRNPCAIKDAGREQYDERKIPTIGQVFELADSVREERRALVLLAALAGLRLSEMLALRRRHVDMLHARVLVVEATVELAHGELITKAPKSSAGRRSLAIDPVLKAALAAHLERFTAPTADAYLFTGAQGGQLRRAVWHKEWSQARASLGLQHVHFHDLRHVHGTLVAQVGATTKETMRRLGHSTTDAAMIYQHATDERDRNLAAAIGARVSRDLARLPKDDVG